MLYACSILYKSKLPFIIVMNKNDIIHHSFVGEWITNFDSFQNALENETSYMSNLTRSLSLVLDEFYENIKFVGVSSTTGNGFDDFMDAVNQAEKDYDENYKMEYEKFKLKKMEQEEKKQKEQLDKFERDFASDRVIGGGSTGIETMDTEVRRANPEIHSTFKDDNEDLNEHRQKVKEIDEPEVDEKLEFESFKKFLNMQK